MEPVCPPVPGRLLRWGRGAAGRYHGNGEVVNTKATQLLMSWIILVTALLGKIATDYERRKLVEITTQLQAALDESRPVKFKTPRGK